MELTAADYVLDLLAKVGVRRIYGVAGTAIFSILDALERNPKITFIAATNELSAGYMALYEARLTGGLGVCLATSGPGATGLASPIADAYFDGEPVLAITGQVKVAQVATRTSQYFAQQSFYQAITEISEQVFDPAALAEVLPRAVGTALAQRTAVHLGIPADIFAKPIVAKKPPMPTKWYPLENFSGDIQTTADQMAAFERPLLILGKEASFVVNEWVVLAERLGAGIVIAQEAKGMVAGDHYLNLGGIGETYLPRLVNEADGIIMVGTASYEKPFLPKVPTVQICNQTLSLDWSLPLVAPLTGNLGILASKLLEMVPVDRVGERWLEEIAHSRQDLQRQLTEEAYLSEQPIHPSKLMSALSLHLAEDAIIVLDIGAFIHWFDKAFWATNQRILLSGYWRGIGAGLPGAVAAKLVFSDKQVVAVVGDGGLLLNPGELGTLRRYNLSVTVVVVNNASYDLERQKMQKKGVSLVGTELPQVNLEKLAAAYGLRYLLAANTGELDAVLAKSLSLTEPVMIDVRCTTPELTNLLVQ